MNTLTCAFVLMCASLAASYPYPDSQPELVQPVLAEAIPVQNAAVEESLEPQESAWGGGYRRYGGFGGFGGYRHGYGGGFGHGIGHGFRPRFGHGFGGGFGGFAVGGIAAGGFGYGR
ncbi:hypothetical protein ABMA28_006409 [Loxostege sticticalis]|uniref:Uncharacterized protein n=1 Tax=Loxostege sticticalis TaxID=481309 RepID=A0ABD0SQ38_LOXSC